MIDTMAEAEKSPANSGARRKTADVPPVRVRDGQLPRDGADPELTEEERRSRIGSAGGGPYAPGAPGHRPPEE